MRTFKPGLLATAAVAASLSAGVAQAQTSLPTTTTPQAQAAADEVVITGSRVIKDGSQAPTPTTVVGEDDLHLTSPNNVADYLRQLPQFQNSTSTRGTALNYFAVGQNFVNLRGLGVNRTLVLLDGRRFVPSNGAGAPNSVDVNLIPSELLKRVEVVTGGASAAYGSDAVSGVVNFVLDTEFTGLKADVQYGISAKSDDENYRASLQAGGSFADDRGHLIASVGYSRNFGVLNPNGQDNPDRPFANGAQVRVANPAVTATNPASATNPRFIVVPNLRIAAVSYNGVVQSGPFANQTFTADGTLAPYNQGTGRSGLYATGGDGWNYARGIAIDAPVTNSNLFVHGSFDLLPNVTAYAEGSSGKSRGWFPSYQPITFASLPSGISIRNDNPYLSAATLTQMSTAGVTSLPVGFVGAQFPTRIAENVSTTRRVVVGLKGKLGSTWSWDTYYQAGENILEANQLNNTNLNNLLLAADAVRNPAGQIVCRSTLTSPNNGCQPINILGNNPISNATLNFVNGSQLNSTKTQQQVAEAQISGEPFALWAGPVSVAGGVGYRKETVERVVDTVSTAPNPLTGQPTGAWLSGNLLPFSGQLDVKEIFGETLIPLAANLPFAKSFDLNAAVRYTDYSLSGGVTSWKVGLNWQPFEDLRIRATQSRDIRSAALNEFFSPGSTSASTVVDRGLNPPATYIPQTISIGNPKLQPEESDTWTAGLVYQPSWLPGLTASVDYYDVQLSGAIVQSSAQIVVDQCVNGVTSFCADIDRDPTTNRITQIRARFNNQASLSTKGTDVELSYRKDLSEWIAGWAGDLDLRLVGTYQPDFLSQTVSTAAVQNLGGGDTRPDKRALFSATYTNGPLTLGLQTQWIGEQKIDPLLTDIDLANNKYDAISYTDLSARYRFEMGGGSYEVFGVVQNVFQPDPPLNVTGFSSLAYTGVVYDGIGRTYRIGLRVRY